MNIFSNSVLPWLAGGMGWLLFASVLVSPVARTALAKPPPYNSHKTLNARLKTLETLHPKYARVVEVGKTPKKRSVLALEVDLTGQFREATPFLLIHGGIHGNEWMSVEVVLHLAELTLADQSTIAPNLRYHFIPAVNGDGFHRGTRHDFDKKGHRYDMNRNFPVPFETDFKSHPIVQAFRDYAKRGNLAGVLDYHTAVQCFSWPWAFSRTTAPEYSEELAQVVVDMSRAVGYGYGQTSKVISYPHQGTAQDYFAYTHKVPAVLMELGPIYGTEVDYAPEILVDQERPFRIFTRWLSARLSRNK